MKMLQPFSPLKHRYFSSETPIFLLRNTDISPLKHRYFSSETPIVYFDGALYPFYFVLCIQFFSLSIVIVHRHGLALAVAIDGQNWLEVLEVDGLVVISPLKHR